MGYRPAEIRGTVLEIEFIFSFCYMHHGERNEKGVFHAGKDKVFHAFLLKSGIF